MAPRPQATSINDSHHKPLQCGDGRDNSTTLDIAGRKGVLNLCTMCNDSRKHIVPDSQIADGGEPPLGPIQSFVPIIAMLPGLVVEDRTYVSLQSVLHYSGTYIPGTVRRRTSTRK